MTLDEAKAEVRAELENILALGGQYQISDPSAREREISRLARELMAARNQSGITVRVDN